MNCQISSFLSQKVNTQLVLMFLAQNITVEILIKIFISLMHKFDFFVITLFDITFSLLNGHDACIEDVYSRNTGLFPFMSQSSCYSIQISPSDIHFFRNCGILLVFIYLFIYLFIPFHFITCIFSVHIKCFVTFPYFPEETGLPCSSPQFSRFSGRKCACWFLLRMMTSSQWMMGQMIQNVMILKRLWIWKLKRNLNLNKIKKIKQLIYLKKQNKYCMDKMSIITKSQMYFLRNLIRCLLQSLYQTD